MPARSYPLLFYLSDNPVYCTRTAALYLMDGVSSPPQPDRRGQTTIPAERGSRPDRRCGAVDELIERVLASETLHPNDFEPKFSNTIIANVFPLSS
jgi:hypothetical protein